MRITWPEGRDFAFTIFDDPDAQTLEVGKDVYRFLTDLGFRTTKGVWPIRGAGPPSDRGRTCEDADYRAWVLELVRLGFEPGLHNVTFHTSSREETRRGLAAFESLFGTKPRVLAQHFNCAENLYWGEDRVSGARRRVYRLLTRDRNCDGFHGHRAESDLFWGDLAKQMITYVRNFVFGDLNTLAACPYMPYHDPERPFVNYWFASSEGANVRSFVARLSDRNLDHLSSQAGACIMYTHFGHGFVSGGKLDPAFRGRMERLARLNGWFVPVSVLLDHLRGQRRHEPLGDRQRGSLEWKWLWHKARFGTA